MNEKRFQRRPTHGTLDTRGRASKGECRTCHYVCVGKAAVKLMLAVDERLDEWRRIVAYLDSFSLTRVLRDRQVWLASLRELQSETQEELDALFAKHPRSEAGASCPAQRVGYRPLRKEQRVRP